MKNFVRVICLILACLFCLLTVVACSGNNNRKKSSSTVEIEIIDGVRWAKDEWGTYREYDDLPDDLDYDEAISVLYWTGTESVKAEFVQTEEVDDSRLSSIYKRNEAIQDRLGVTLNFTAESGYSSTMDSFVARVDRAEEADTNDFDIIAAYSRAQGAMLLAGLIKNLSAIENNYISAKGIGDRTDSKPWWPANLAGNLAIKNNLYYVSGDISMTAIDNLHCVYFNKELVDAKYQFRADDYFATNDHVRTVDEDGNALEDSATNWLYEIAYAGDWTLDELIALSSGAGTDESTYRDSTGDGVSRDDTYGLCSIYYCMAALYGGSNLRMIEQDENTVLKVSGDWNSLKTTTLVARLNTLLASNNYHTSQKTGAAYYQPFLNGKCYFSLYYLRMAEDFLLNNDNVEEYGILPVPKYDLNQRNYYTVVGNEFSIFSIFIECDKRGDVAATDSMLTAVLECWASEAFRKTTPVVFEMNMKLKSSPTQAEADMCEIIRASTMFDMGRILDSALGGEVANNTINMDSLMANAALDNTSWSTITGEYSERMNTNLAAFVTKLQKTLV